MEIYLNDDDVEKIEVKVVNYDRGIEDSNDLAFNLAKGLSTIVDEMVRQIANDAPLEDRKFLASKLLELSKSMVEMFYDEQIEQRDKRTHTAELYEAMETCYKMALKNAGVDEDEIISCAKNSIEPDFVVNEDNGSFFNCKVVFDTKEVTLGIIPVEKSDKEIEVECWKATAAAIVLFDKAFPDDRSKHPSVLYHSLNLYYDLVKASREDGR